MFEKNSDGRFKSLEEIRKVALLEVNETIRLLEESHFFSQDFLDIAIPIYHEWTESHGSRYTAIVNLLLGQSTTEELGVPSVQKAKSVLEEKNAQNVLLPQQTRELFDSVLKQVELNFPQMADPADVLKRAMNLFLVSSAPPRPAENKRIERQQMADRIKAFYDRMHTVDPELRSRTLRDSKQKTIEEKLRPIISRIQVLLDRNNYGSIANILNEEGFRSVEGLAFTVPIVSNIVHVYGLTRRGDLIEEKRSSEISRIDSLLNGFPYPTENESEQARQALVEVKTKNPSTVISKYITDHPNASFLYKKILWKNPLPLCIQQYLGVFVELDNKTDSLSLIELITSLLENHPDNGIEYKQEIYKQVTSELQAFFELFHHPYAKLLTEIAFIGFVEKNNLDKLLTAIPRKTHDFYRAPNGKTILLSEIQALLDKELSYAQVATTLQERGINCSTEAIHDLVQNKEMRYAKAENEARERKRKHHLFFEKLNQIQTLRQNILKTLPEDRDTEFWNVLNEVLTRIRELKANEELCISVVNSYGSTQAQILEAMETGTYPEPDITTLGYKKLRSDYYVLLTEWTTELIDSQLHLEKVPLTNKDGEIIANAVNVGNLVESVVLHLLSTEKRYKNYLEFYEVLTAEIREIFILDIQLYAETISAEALSKLLSHKFPKLHKQVIEKLNVKPKPRP